MNKDEICKFIFVIYQKHYEMGIKWCEREGLNNIAVL